MFKFKSLPATAVANNFGPRTGPINCWACPDLDPTCLTDGIPERFFEKIIFKSADDKKACKITQHAELRVIKAIFLW